MTKAPSRGRPLLIALSVLCGVGTAATAQVLVEPGIEHVSTVRSGKETPPAESGQHATSTTTTSPSTTERTRSIQHGSTTASTTTSRQSSTTSSTSEPANTTRDTPRETSADRETPADRVLELVNQHRAEAGCTELRTDDRLARAAQQHSTDMATRGYFAHTSPDGVTFQQRIRRAGYPRPGAENIAYGQRSAERVMQVWMNSSGHRANILNCSFNSIGIGLEKNGWYWTQNFGY